VNQAPLFLRATAIRDVEDAIAFYRSSAGTAVALRFIDALERAYRHIERYPDAGSPRLAHELDIANLRSWLVRGFPHVIFYIPTDAHVEVLRVLHGARDIPTSLQEN